MSLLELYPHKELMIMMLINDEGFTYLILCLGTSFRDRHFGQNSY